MEKLFNVSPSKPKINTKVEETDTILKTNTKKKPENKRKIKWLSNTATKKSI